MVSLTGIAYASDDNALPSNMPDAKEHYEIEIKGLKDEYVIGEPYSFYFVISGYGYECGGIKVAYPDSDGKLQGGVQMPLCDAKLVMHNFEISSVDRQKNSESIAINKSGTYTVTVTFERPDKYFPTTISKEFRVVEYIDENSDNVSTLKKIQSETGDYNLNCKDGLHLVYKKSDKSSACVTIFTEIELVIRGWATDNRVMLDCTGGRIQKCYPDDPIQYRNDLYEYYFGEDDKDFPSHAAFNFDSLYTKNACTDKPSICYGKFENGTQMRIACDYPLHGCRVKPFDSYKTNNDETGTIPWKKYITISTSNVDHSEIPDSLSVYEIDDLSDYTMIEMLLAGADGCKNETEVCTISRGVSFDRMYPFGITVTGSDQYTATINEKQAEELVSQIKWTIKDDLIYSIVSYHDKNYLLVISTFDKTRTPDAEMRLVGVPSDPVALKRNSVLEYPIQVDTWATYGANAEITLDSIHNARDSGINTWIEPDTLIIPERSNATSTLFIHATEDAQDGIYDIRVMGKANGGNIGLHCGRTDCPTIQIGDSDWSIRTFGSNTGMGIGSGDAPENTYVEIELNKEEFFDGETVEIKAYLVNNGTQAVVLNEPMNLLIKAIRADSKGYYSHFYGIDARNESDNSITIEPNSKAVLVRPFYWDQMTFENIDEEYRVEQGSRKMTATFVAREHTWKDDLWFEIK